MSHHQLQVAPISLFHRAISPLSLEQVETNNTPQQTDIFQGTDHNHSPRRRNIQGSNGTVLEDIETYKLDLKWTLLYSLVLMTMALFFSILLSIYHRNVISLQALFLSGVILLFLFILFRLVCLVATVSRRLRLNCDKASIFSSAASKLIENLLILLSIALVCVSFFVGNSKYFFSCIPGGFITVFNLLFFACKKHTDECITFFEMVRVSH